MLILLQHFELEELKAQGSHVSNRFVIEAVDSHVAQAEFLQKGVGVVAGYIGGIAASSACWFPYRACFESHGIGTPA